MTFAFPETFNHDCKKCFAECCKMPRDEAGIRGVGANQPCHLQKVVGNCVECRIFKTDRLPDLCKYYDCKGAGNLITDERKRCGIEDYLMNVNPPQELRVVVENCDLLYMVSADFFQMIEIISAFTPNSQVTTYKDEFEDLFQTFQGLNDDRESATHIFPLFFMLNGKVAEYLCGKFPEYQEGYSAYYMKTQGITAAAIRGLETEEEKEVMMLYGAVHMMICMGLCQIKYDPKRQAEILQEVHENAMIALGYDISAPECLGVIRELCDQLYIIDFAHYDEMWNGHIQDKRKKLPPLGALRDSDLETASRLLAELAGKRSKGKKGGGKPKGQRHQKKKKRK